MTHSGMFVDGRWQDTSSDETVELIDPHSEEVWGHGEVATAADVDRAVAAAKRALASDWQSWTLDDRIKVVLRIGELLESRRDELAELTVRSIGSPHGPAKVLGGAVQLIKMYVESVRKVNFEYLRREAVGQALVTRRPVGVVAGIVPWNAPIRSEVKKSIPALLCGCTVVLKAAPEAPFAAMILAEVAAEAGLPPGVLNVIPGGPETGAALVQHPDVNKIAFTGSTATGARIAADAAPTFKRLQLELGGKSAAILLDDFDLGTTIPLLVRGAWANTGQKCVALSRVLVPRSRHDELVAALGEAAAAQRVGNPMDPATTMGPLSSRKQLDRVLGYLELGVSEGARIAVGGGRPAGLDHGYYVEPTVLIDVTNDMRVAREEIFGPVMCVIPYDTVDEAVEIANDSPFGLHGGVYGRDEEQALAVARRLDTGSVGVNMHYLPDSAPFGGLKASGVGREHGREGFDSFLEYVSYNVTPSIADTLATRMPTL